MNTKPILDYMEQQGLGVKGKSLFRDHMPAAAQQGLLLTNQTMTKISPDVPGYVHGAFEVTAREATFDAARATMDNVIDVMSGEGLQIDDMCFFYIRPYTTPLVHPVSDSFIVEASVLFDFRFILT